MFSGIRTCALTLSASCLISIGLYGCPSSDNNNSSISNNGISSATGAAMAGKAVADKYLCASCHTGDLSGSTMAYPGTTAYAANLTPDMETGLGEWDAVLIKNAILTGLDDEGEQLCTPMPRFQEMNMTDAEATDLVAYLQSLSPVPKEVPESACEGKGGDEGEGQAGAGGL